MKGLEYSESTLKRSVDILIASLLLALSSPVWIFMFLYNKARCQPLFFRQERIGKGGRKFCLLKFETLYKGAELEDWDKQSYQMYSYYRETHDPRAGSVVMRFLRKSGLNELPQLLNVIRGDMSIVGPRPLTLEYHDELSFLLEGGYTIWWKRALMVKPGLLGIKPLETRHLPMSEFHVRAKWDTQYTNEASLWFDILTILEGCLCVFLSSLK